MKVNSSFTSSYRAKIFSLRRTPTFMPLFSQKISQTMLEHYFLWKTENESKSILYFFFQGKKIEPEKNTNLFATEDTLIVRGVHEANNGAYQCLATNQVGQGTSNTQTVNVKGKVTIILSWPYFLTLEFWVGLDRTKDMSFLTGQDRTPKFAGQVLPDRSCRTGLKPDLYFQHFTYQVWVNNSHKIRSLDTSLVSKVNKQKNLEKNFE